MSFLFPIISSVSVVLTCGYLLYKYYIKPNIIDLNEDNIQNNENTSINENISRNENKAIKKYEYKNLDNIIIDSDRPTLIAPTINRNDYSPIKSSDSDFDIINDTDINEN